MGALPDKILDDSIIEMFVDNVNETSKEIISDSKFEIPSPSLPGVGMLIKFMVRIFEKSLAVSFAPVFLGKEALSNGLDAIIKAVDDIGALISNPLQFLLDEGINNPISEFPFPVRIIIDSGPSDSKNQELKEIIDNVTPILNVSDDSKLTLYDYNLKYGVADNPINGEATTSALNLIDIKEIRISNVTKNGDINISMPLLETSDNIHISSGDNSNILTISKITNNNSYIIFDVIPKNTDPDNIIVNVPGFSESIEVGNEQNIILRDFTKDGALVIPFSVIGVNIPVVKNLALSIGDFTNVSDDSPTKKYLTDLGIKSGLTVNEVFSGILKGDFPKIDFEKLQAGDNKEKAKEDLIGFGRLLQLAISDPFFLIKILLNYFKLLLLPISVIIGVLSGLVEKVAKPAELIKMIILGITNPLKLLCDLISEAFLIFLEPYIAPHIAPIMSYEEAKVDPNDSGRGLRPLFSDLICGAFDEGFSEYTPSQDFFNRESNKIVTTLPDEGFIDLPYYISEDGLQPTTGEIIINSNNIKEINNIRVSSITNTVENSLPVLVNTSIGSKMTLSIGGDYGLFTITSKEVKPEGSTVYFDFNVSLNIAGSDDNIEYPTLISDNNPENNDKLKGALSVENPDKTFLYIIEKYLPIELIAIWESIKGIIAVMAGIAIEVPKLLPEVIGGLFGKSSSEVANDGVKESLDLLYGDTNSISYISTKDDDGDYDSDNRKIWENMIQNSSSNIDDGIEVYFAALNESLKAEERSGQINKAKLSRVIPERANSNLYRYDEDENIRRLGADDFYYGAYSLSDLGESVKVLNVIMYSMKNVEYYDERPNDYAENNNITVYITENDERVELYSGNILNALKKYKVSKSSTSDIGDPREIRIFINREIDLISRYLLPSLSSN